jgi:hypothetical protein
MAVAAKTRSSWNVKEDMKRRGLASTELGNCLGMTFAVDIAFRTQCPSQLVYTFPSQNAWMGH